MDRGAWWAVVYGVARSQTRLKRLSSSSSSASSFHSLALIFSSQIFFFLMDHGGAELICDRSLSGRWEPLRGTSLSSLHFLVSS